MRSRKVALATAVVVLGILMAGVTLPRARQAEDPGVAEDPVPAFAVRSSTRGTISVALPTAGTSVVGGRPFNPHHQIEAAATLSEPAPAAPGVTPPRADAESVLGSDGRTWLRGLTAQYPNSAIGRIDFRQNGRNSWCTGTLIDADTVLTAGHCVHDGYGTEAGWSTRVKFLPGVEGNTARFGKCGARELLTLPAWYDRGAEYQDLGLVQLDCSIGDVVGWFGYRSMPGRHGLDRAMVNLRGYPGDMRWGSLWTMRGRLTASQAQMAFYDLDTYGGQSGSPLYDQRPCNGMRGPCILAVHAYGPHGRRLHGSYNHGPRLDETKVALLNALAAPAG